MIQTPIILGGALILLFFLSGGIDDIMENLRILLIGIAIGVGIMHLGVI